MSGKTGGPHGPGGPGGHGGDGVGEEGGGPPDSGGSQLPVYAERVLAVAELIPPGRVMTYGDIAEWLAGEDPPEGCREDDPG